MKDLKYFLDNLYGEDAGGILDSLDLADTDNCEAVEVSTKDQVERKRADRNWYQKMQLYVAYPDSFCEDGKCDLHALRKKIPYLKKLGINALHILPFFKSPMIDMGFDVADYLNVREDVGGNEAFESILREATENGITVFADIILNHVSNQHEWFKKAVSGEEKYRNYFIFSEQKPEFIKKFKDEDAVWARYLINGEQKDICIIFPTQAGEVPHWYQAQDGIWYYHSFYPHQIDTNWNNPDVFVEYAKILKYWAEKGVSFRLDAIPYIGKDILNGVISDSDRTHKLVTALNKVVKAANPESVFLAEACVEIENLKNYFQTDGEVESEVAYNFAMTRALWLAVMTGETDMIWEVLEKTNENVPDFAGWVNFLRNHDEMSFERMDPDFRKALYDLMKEGGLEFREGFGLAGRTASFLECSSEKIAGAYMLLASLPGSPAVIYGDEIGKENDIEYMKSQTSKKRQQAGDSSIADDARECNRGIIRPEDIALKKASEIYEKLSKIFNARNEVGDVFTKLPKKLDCSTLVRIPGNLELSSEVPEADCVFGAVYELGDEKFVVLINLQDASVELELKKLLEDDHWAFEPVLEINLVSIDSQEHKIDLGGFSGVWGYVRK